MFSPNMGFVSFQSLVPLGESSFGAKKSTLRKPEERRKQRVRLLVQFARRPPGGPILVFWAECHDVTVPCQPIWPVEVRDRSSRHESVLSPVA